MEYHYQWPEYLDATSSEGNGWESMCASPPPFYTDTPAMPSCISRVLPRGRPMRRRRLFPRPFNHFARGVRPQWSTPYYDCGYKWTPEPHVTKVCAPQFDTCFDYESLLDKTSAEKQPNTTTKKIRKCKGSSQLYKPVQVVKNSDQSMLRSNRIEWIEHGQQSECNSPAGTVPIGYQSSFNSSMDSLCKSPEGQESSHSTLISACNNESRKYKSSQNSLPLSVKISAVGSEKYPAENEKEDMLTSIINKTILEESKDVTNNCQDITDSQQNQLGKEPSKACQGSYMINRPSDPFQNLIDGNSEFVDSSQNISENPYCDELFYSDSLVNFPNNISKEIELAIFNLQQVDQHLDSTTQDPKRYDDQVLSSNQQNVCNEAETNNSLIVHDPLKLQQSINENITVESAKNVNVMENKNSSNDQFSKDSNSHPFSSEKEDSISSLAQKNELLTDLLSQLISGDFDFEKHLLTSNKLLPETGNYTGEVQINLTEKSKVECASLQTDSGEEPVNVFQNFHVTDVNMPDLNLAQLHAKETSTNSYSIKQSTNINVMNSPKCSNKIPEACEVTTVATVDEFMTSNSMVVQENDFSLPTEIFPTKIDYPSSESDSNLKEATLSSITNYLLEEPLDNFPGSFFDDENSLDILSSCVKPNSVLKVKKPRKRYVKTFQRFKVKNKEKNICKASSKCKKLTSKCLKLIRKCKHKICNEERDSHEENRNSDKGLRDAGVQVEESGTKTIKTRKVSNTRDVGTQWEVLENHCSSLQDAISLRKELHGECKCSNPTFPIEEQPNTEEKNNLIKKEDVLVMLVEIPLNLKKLSTESRNLKVEVVDNTKMQAESNDLGQMTLKKGRIIGSFTKISDSKTKSLAMNSDYSYGTRTSTKAKGKVNQDAEASRNDRTTPISKPSQSNDLTKEISHVRQKSSEIQGSESDKITPDLCGGSDRVLRKRKAVKYSDPGPSKRKRFNNEEPEVEFVNEKPTKKVKNKNLKTDFSGEDKDCLFRSNMLLRNRNSSEFSGGEQSKKEQHNKSLRPKSG